MADAPTDAPGTPASSGGGKLGIWKKKYGPLPLWGWALILLAAILGYLYYKNRNSASTTASATTASDTTGAGQIPQFVNQTYTTVTPPAAAPTPVSTSSASTSNQIPGHHVVTSNGTQTLAQIASQYGTTPADIIAFTKAHKPHESALEKKFFSKPNGKVPKGILLWVPEPQVTNITGPGPGGAGTSGGGITVNPGGPNIPT
jgi:hypothetical protein